MQLWHFVSTFWLHPHSSHLLILFLIALILHGQVRIMFEVQDLKYATLATVSRCGMVWFSEEVVTPEMVIYNYLNALREIPLEESEEDLRHMLSRTRTTTTESSDADKALSPTMQVKNFLLLSVWNLLLQNNIAKEISSNFQSNILIAFQWRKCGMSYCYHLRSQRNQPIFMIWRKDIAF